MLLVRSAVVGLLLAAFAAPGARAGPWEVRADSEGKNRAAVSNDAGTISLNIFCGGDGAMVGIERSAAVPWLGKEPAELVVDDEVFPIVPVAEGETWGVFNLKPIALKPAMIDALRTGASFEIRGTAASGVAAPALTFTLQGSSRALDEVPGGCT